MANHLSWYDTVFIPSTVYVTILLEFLIQHNSTTKLNKKYSFAWYVTVVYLWRLVVHWLVVCEGYCLYVKKIYNFLSSILNIKCVFFLTKWFINDSDYSKLILLRFQVLNLKKRYKRSFKSLLIQKRPSRYVL